MCIILSICLLIFQSQWYLTSVPVEITVNKSVDRPIGRFYSPIDCFYGGCCFTYKIINIQILFEINNWIYPYEYSWFDWLFRLVIDVRRLRRQLRTNIRHVFFGRQLTTFVWEEAHHLLLKPSLSQRDILLNLLPCHLPFSVCILEIYTY